MSILFCTENLTIGMANRKIKEGLDKRRGLAGPLGLGSRRSNRLGKHGRECVLNEDSYHFQLRDRYYRIPLPCCKETLSLCTALVQNDTP